MKFWVSGFNNFHSKKIPNFAFISELESVYMVIRAKSKAFNYSCSGLFLGLPRTLSFTKKTNNVRFHEETWV